MTVTHRVFWQFVAAPDRPHEKYRKYGRIAKILADSVSAGPIYPTHLTNPKLATKNFSVKIANV